MLAMRSSIFSDAVTNPCVGSPRSLATERRNSDNALRHFDVGRLGIRWNNPNDGLRACGCVVNHGGITVRTLDDLDALAGLLLVSLKVKSGTESGLFKTRCSDGGERLRSHSRDR